MPKNQHLPSFLSKSIWFVYGLIFDTLDTISPSVKAAWVLRSNQNLTSDNASGIK